MDHHQQGLIPALAPKLNAVSAKLAPQLEISGKGKREPAGAKGTTYPL
jgi:hypothetical protein